MRQPREAPDATGFGVARPAVLPLIRTLSPFPKGVLDDAQRLIRLASPPVPRARAEGRFGGVHSVSIFVTNIPVKVYSLGSETTGGFHLVIWVP
jgi:hypothetical protein